MKLRDQIIAGITVIILITCVAVSCATVPELKIHYLLPLSGDRLKGRSIFLVFRDDRKTEDIMGEGAKERFRYFSGDFSLFLNDGIKGKGTNLGLYDVRSLFMEVFNRRLKSLGVTVVPEKGMAQFDLVIILREFSLDLINKKWIARISYEARLEDSGKMVKSQIISGDAERLKIIGNSQAHTVMSEIFTDIINRLDLGALFRYESNV
ncbi:MAG TPA: hypothetical protein VJ373_06265 [Desulfatiglandales bacterium]|nr:hypothetical protein [Desulfatiglandales bacterium]